MCFDSERCSAWQALFRALQGRRKCGVLAGHLSGTRGFVARRSNFEVAPSCVSVEVFGKRCDRRSVARV